MAYKRYVVKGNKDPVSGRYLYSGIVIVNDEGIIADAAPVWGIYMGQPMDNLNSIAKERGYVIESVEG